MYPYFEQKCRIIICHNGNWVKKGDHYKVDKKVPDLPFFKMTEAKKKKGNRIKLLQHCLILKFFKYNKEKK